MKKSIFLFFCWCWVVSFWGCFQKEPPPPEKIEASLRLEYQAASDEMVATAVLTLGEGLDKRPLFSDDQIRFNDKSMSKEYRSNKGVFYQWKDKGFKGDASFQFEDYQKEIHRYPIPFQNLVVNPPPKTRHRKGAPISLEVQVPKLQKREQIFVAYIAQNKLMAPLALEVQEGTILLPTDHLPKGKIKAFLYRLNQYTVQEDKTTVHIHTKILSPLFDFDIF